MAIVNTASVGAMGALAVCLGAFGAHGLKGKVDPALIKTWETAAHYHLIHSAALLALTTAAPGVLSKRALKTAPPLLLAGTIVFSGSLYALVLTGQKKLGAVTPIGGLMLVAGWAALGL
mmetsp:Transcript_22401/g.56007  ORF Transcript_22401/g.56007 Transcript_22401/m.56007 type:complete len:119 (-) Transcript_22401:82-438(-)